MEKCIKRISCASCGNKHQREMLDLGNIPFVGQFPTKKELNNQIRWQLKLMFCDKCKLVQTDSLINPKIAFKNYHYLSSISLSKHFNELANILDSRYNIKGKSILEIGSNDGVLLEPLSKLGAIVEGVDPSDNPVKIAKNKLRIIRIVSNPRCTRSVSRSISFIIRYNSIVCCHGGCYFTFSGFPPCKKISYGC